MKGNSIQRGPRHNSGRPSVYEVRCPDCGWKVAEAANGSFLHMKCGRSSCKLYFSGFMVDGEFICVEGRGREKPVMQTGPPTAVG